ncbi:TIGR03862 family flavoprotein [Plastoroseomonas hellenica]|uniref:TIGR03862 family flavoprotein n=1 Tax=Plastoroseomonas hellenica TaxID=2687306 RepID=UPI001BA9B2B2|nr:TIGR03862 family flavoprotein [Plastoroseomonas hellenica]MBR0643283.1 TIGR03862 family flavoprotein [Plastoroseomonas hellenica]
MPDSKPRIAVIGAGPAGLIATEILAAAGVLVDVFERMPSPARKLLIAGRGGLNLTHSEPLERFLTRYREAAPHLAPHIRAFPPAALAAWCEGLGQPVFTGSSGRVFPRAMKASPLLRAWLARLAALGVRLHTRQVFEGFGDDGGLLVSGRKVATEAVILACGGASWPRLGSDGAWAALLPGVPVAPFRPANMGFRVAWSEHLRGRFAGTPLKRIALRFGTETQRGEAVVTEAGIEGGAVYALSAPLREAIARDGHATLQLDLRPDLDAAECARRLAAPRGGQSLSNHLRRSLNLAPVAIALVQEALHAGAAQDDLAALVKALPLRLDAPMPIARAISSAGGLSWAALDERLMLRARPGVFAAGEMLDWEAPTGGYLLQACFATGVAAARGALDWLAARGAIDWLAARQR